MMADLDEPKIQILYFEHSYRSVTMLHSHSYCQIEYCMGSPMRIYDGTNYRMLAPQHAWIIPPDTKHQFLNTEKQDFLSLKFCTPAALQECITGDKVISLLLENICHIVDQQKTLSPHSAEGHFLMEHYLAGIIDRLSGIASAPDTSAFEARFFAAVCHQGAQLSVDNLAEFFNLSRAQFKYAFFKETGSGDIKGTISRYLIKMAQQDLQYSDKSLGKIAEQLHFSSIYAFSRFFKQHCGISPLGFRKNFISGKKHGM